MTIPSDSNPTGVEPFNHATFAKLPEYDRAALAIQDLVAAIQRADIELPQEQWLATVHQIAAALAFMDSCRACGDYDPHPAVTVQIDGDRLLGTYRCVAGHHWQCHWSVSYIPVIA